MDPFDESWPEVPAMLAGPSGLQAKKIFGELQLRYTGRSLIAVLSIAYREVLLQYGLHWQTMTSYVTGNIKGFIVKEKLNLFNWGIVDGGLEFFKPPV